MTVIVPKQDIKESLEEATGAYQDQLQNDDEALQYLLQDRKISKEALEYFRLGVARVPQPGHEHFRNRISFPYVTENGVTSIRFRYLGDHGDNSKFLYITGDGPRIYNPMALQGATSIFICEGETDTIACWQSGLPAVGFTGAETWLAKDRITNRCLGYVYARAFLNRHVTVLADNDDQGAGKDFANDIYKFLGGCDILMMDPGYDVSKFVRDYGEQELLKKVGWEG